MQAQLERQGAFDEAHVRPAIAKLEELQRTQQRVDEKKEDIPSFALSQEEKTLLADIPGDLPDADEGTEILSKHRSVAQHQAAAQGVRARLDGEKSKADSLSASLTQLESVISSHMDAVAEPKKPAGTALIVVGILLVIAGAALGVLMMPVLVAVAAVGLLLCIIGVTGKSSYKKKVQAFEAYKQADAQRQEANQKKAELQAQLTREQTEIASLEQELGEHNAVIDSDGSVISTWIARWGQADGEVSETIITQIMDRAAVVRRLREKQAAADSVQDFVNEQTASINAERAAINTLYVEHQPVVDHAEGQRISGLADGQPILAETHIGVNQVQLLPRQVVVCRSVLDDFVDLGHRPCEGVFGLLGEGGQGFCKR